ncbi:hypothetical protein KDA_63300 [Dictyobacter alpinus]|uniref:Uncharacterized protein n=1 Tax=Dictyobacter alpinus TaxID=2014873 RepID=A0A402BHN0_9CHLR|nr:hypothetical protein [Dictyobacter alpinus]GCE30846.1 hypothetical protein KDA_63300 [Dictyobacter alpinus]
MVPEKRRPLFREHALQQYMQRRENDILPRIVSPPVFLFSWLLFALVIGSGVVAWLTRVPIYVNSAGVAVSNEYSINARQSEVNVLVFVPVNTSNAVRSGAHGITQFASSSQSFEGTITHLDSIVLSPGTIQRQYQLSCSTAQQIRVPSVAVSMYVVIPAGMHIYSGMPLQTRIQTGTQRVLALIPILGGWIGGP